MAWTLAEIRSAIHSDITDGLKGVANYTYSEDQIEREISAERSKILFELTKGGRFKFEKQGFEQQINCIPVDTKQLSKCPTSIPVGDDLKHFEIPPISTLHKEDTVGYIGPVSREEPEWKIYTDDNYLFHPYKLRIACKPFVYIATTINENNKYDAFIKNYNNDNLKYVSITGIFENPTDIEDYSCTNPDWLYPAPEWAVNDIIKRLVEKYIRYYRQLNVLPQPNTQTELNA